MGERGVYGGGRKVGEGGKKGWRGIAVILMSLRDLSCLNRNSTTETFHHQREEKFFNQDKKNPLSFLIF